MLNILFYNYIRIYPSLAHSQYGQIASLNQCSAAGKFYFFPPRFYFSRSVGQVQRLNLFALSQHFKKDKNHTDTSDFVSVLQILFLFVCYVTSFVTADASIILYLSFVRILLVSELFAVIISLSELNWSKPVK